MLSVIQILYFLIVVYNGFITPDRNATSFWILNDFFCLFTFLYERDSRGSIDSRRKRDGDVQVNVCRFLGLLIRPLLANLFKDFGYGRCVVSSKHLQTFVVFASFCSDFYNLDRDIPSQSECDAQAVYRPIFCHFGLFCNIMRNDKLLNQHHACS